MNEIISKTIELDFVIKKSKHATIGEIREWSGKKYQKQSGGWVLVKEGKEKKEEVKDKLKIGDEFYSSSSKKLFFIKKIEEDGSVHIRDKKKPDSSLSGDIISDKDFNRYLKDGVFIKK